MRDAPCFSLLSYLCAEDHGHRAAWNHLFSHLGFKPMQRSLGQGHATGINRLVAPWESRYFPESFKCALKGVDCTAARWAR